MSKTPEYEYLDKIALAVGTDKSSAAHNYTKIYSEYFHKLKDKPIKFLEIGIMYGSSVRLWEQYFTHAELHFIDITNTLIRYYSERSHYHFFDQADPKALEHFLKITHGNFDIIIDDGGHMMNQQIISFLVLFPSLKSGGMYVIEDLHTSYWQSFGGGGTIEDPRASPNATTEFLKKLVDDLNFTAARIGIGQHDKTPPEIRLKLNYFQEHINSIHFYESLAIIIKS